MPLIEHDTFLTGYTRTYGFSRQTLFLLVCMRVRFGPLLTYKAKRWTVPLKFSCWQCWKGYWGSKTPRLYGVSCESVDWNPYSSIGFTRQCSCTILYLNPTATQWWIRSYMLTCSWVQDPLMPVSPYSFCHGWLTQSYTFKQKLQHCEPIDLSRFVVDLRERHLEY